MRRLIVLALALLLPATLTAKEKEKKPVINFAPMLRLIGAHGVAHACPISPDFALTAAHVTDLRPFSADVPLFASRFSTATQEGRLEPLFTARDCDLAVMHPMVELTAYYPLTQARPQRGDRLYWVEYNWSRRREAMQRVEIEAVYLNTIAGHVIADREPTEGASGGCILNARNEVVGVVAWGLSYGASEGIGIGPAVFPPWDEGIFDQISARIRGGE